MAAEADFASFDLTPEQRLKSRRVALDKYTNVAQPAAQKQFDAQTGQALAKARGQVGQAAEQGGWGARTDMQSKLGQAAKDLAKLTGQQDTEQTGLDYQGAQMEEDLIRSRQIENIQKFQRDADQEAYTLGEAVARRAFDMGMDTKQLILHNNAVVADAAFEQTKKDYQEGRINTKDLLKMKTSLAVSAEGWKAQYEALMTQLQGDLDLAIQTKNIDRAKARLKKAIELQKEAATQAAMAAGIGAILGAGATIASGNPVVGAAVGGVASGIAGSF